MRFGPGPLRGPGLRLRPPPCGAPSDRIATRSSPQPKTPDDGGASDSSRFAAVALSKDGLRLLAVIATRPGQSPPSRRVVCSKMEPSTSFQSYPFAIAVVTNQGPHRRRRLPGKAQNPKSAQPGSRHYARARPQATVLCRKRPAMAGTSTPFTPPVASAL